MKNKIVFTNTFVSDLSLYEPYPAVTKLPKWYKDTDSYLGDGAKRPMIGLKGGTPATIKRCVPVFDALGSGYVIPTYVDLYVTKQDDGATWFQWPDYEEPIQFHSLDQAPLHPLKNGQSYPKWINPWGIRTPKGWSTLFLPPMHSENTFFSIFPGIVDTDSYTAPVNFPFIMNDLGFTGIIPAGTPMVQVIPIKRADWKIELGNKEDVAEQFKVTQQLRSSFFDSYRTKFWSRKSYR